MQVPGPDHPITIEPNGNRVRVILAGVVIAETTRALTLRESTYRPVHYIPRENARMELFARTGHRTRCPYKGEAAHFAVRAGTRVAENAAWSYEDPYPALAAIAGRLAFYPGRVDAIEEGV